MQCKYYIPLEKATEITATQNYRGRHLGLIHSGYRPGDEIGILQFGKVIVRNWLMLVFLVLRFVNIVIIITMFFQTAWLIQLISL